MQIRNDTLNVARLPFRTPVFKHGGAGNRASRVSHFLTRHECESILAASERASKIGRAFNRHVTIRLAWLGIPPARIHAALEAWLKYWRDWIATKGERLAYIFTLENAPTVREHAHILLHLPPELAAAFFKRQPKWRSKIVARFADPEFSGTDMRARVVMTRAIGGSDKAYLTNPTHHAANLHAVTGYVLKAAKPEIIAALNLAKQHKPGGIIIGRRAGWWSVKQHRP